MKIVWYRTQKPTPPPVSGSEENAPSAWTSRRSSYSTWLDEMITQHERDGGFEQLEGKGKPLNLEGDSGFDVTVHRILKDAHVLPKWVELHKEIHADLQRLIRWQQTHPEEAVDVTKINEKIRKYNAACPSSLLQKPLVMGDRLEEDCLRWQ